MYNGGTADLHHWVSDSHVQNKPGNSQPLASQDGKTSEDIGSEEKLTISHNVLDLQVSTHRQYHLSIKHALAMSYVYGDKCTGNFDIFNSDIKMIPHKN